MSKIANKRFWACAAALVAGIALIYGQTGGFEQLAYDDEGYTVDCPFVRDGLSVGNILAAFGNLTWGGIYMPLTYASYMAVISAFGPSHGAQHLVSAFFHAVDAVLFLALLLRLAGWSCARRERDERDWDRQDADGRGKRDKNDKRNGKEGWGVLAAAFFAAALWAWHPQRVESVAWIASRKDTLFAMFTLLGLFAWMDRRYWLAYLMMLCGCLSKPTAMVFPALAACVELLGPAGSRSGEDERDRLDGKDGDGQDKNWRDWRNKGRFWRAVPRYLPLLAMAALTAAVAAYSQTHGEGDAARPLFYSTFGWRLLNALVSLGMYFYHAVVPVGLQFWYRPIRGGIPLHAPLALGALGVVAAGWCVAFLRCRGWRRALFAAALWFFAGIGPTLGIAGSFGNHAFADRFTYLPMMAVSILAMLVAGVRGRKAVQQNGRTRGATRGTGGRAGGVPPSEFRILPFFIVLPVLLVLSFAYARTYRNNLTAFENIAKWDPGHSYAWSEIGSETIMRTGDFRKGIEYLRKSIAIFPAEETEERLVTALIALNDARDEDEIVRLCMKEADWSTSPNEGVIPLIPAEKDKDGLRMEALGMIATRHFDWPNAIRCFEAAIERGPEREDCRMRLAMSYWNAKRRAEALPHLRILAESQRPDIEAKARELLAVGAAP